MCGIMITACKTQPSLPNLHKTGQTSDLPLYDSKGSLVALGQLDSTKYDSLLYRLIALENAVWSNPRDLKCHADLLATSLDSASGCFLVAGKGVPNKSLPEASWKQGRKIASIYDAKRWALYCKTWAIGGAKPFGTRISGEITYTRTLLERLDGDTLFSLVSVPTGSIIEK
jgi:hypothetical protein